MTSSSKSLLGDVLVTGGCGFLGFNLVNQLLNDNDCGSVHVLDRDTTHNRIDGVNYIKASITDEATVRALIIDEIQPRLIFHCASPNFSFPTVGAPGNDQFVSNVTGTEILLQAARDSLHTEALVFTSTVDAYSSPPHDNVNETHPTWHVNAISTGNEAYGHSKAMAARKVLAANVDEGTGTGCLKTAVVAHAHTYGVRDSQLTRLMLDTYADQSVPLVVIGTGDNMVSVLSVENGATAHRLVAKALLEPLRANGKVAGETFIAAEDPPIPFWHHMRTMWKAARGEAALDDIWNMPGWLMNSMAFCVRCLFLFFTLGFVKPPSMFAKSSVSYILHSHTYDSRKLREVIGFHPKSSDHDRIVAEAVKWEIERRKNQDERKQD